MLPKSRSPKQSLSAHSARAAVGRMQSCGPRKSTDSLVLIPMASGAHQPRYSGTQIRLDELSIPALLPRRVVE